MIAFFLIGNSHVRATRYTTAPHGSHYASARVRASRNM